MSLASLTPTPPTVNVCGSSEAQNCSSSWWSSHAVCGEICKTSLSFDLGLLLVLISRGRSVGSYLLGGARSQFVDQWEDRFVFFPKVACPY